MTAPDPAQFAETRAAPWPLDPLPFGYSWISSYPPQPVTVQFLMHRLHCLTEALEEIGEALEEWWECEGEDQNPINPETGYRDLPRYYEQWLMNASNVADCQKVIHAYWDAVKVLDNDGSPDA